MGAPREEQVAGMAESTVQNDATFNESLKGVGRG